CAGCKAPVSWHVDAPNRDIPPKDPNAPIPGSLMTRCPACQVEAAYTLPQPPVVFSGLSAVLTDALRTDAAPAVQRRDAAGVQALSCPGCGAALQVPQHGGIVTCTFCRASSRVTTGAPGAGQPFVPFWLLVDPAHARRIAGEARKESRRFKLILLG